MTGICWRDVAKLFKMCWVGCITQLNFSLHIFCGDGQRNIGFIAQNIIDADRNRG